MVDAQLSTRLGDSIQEDFRSYTAEFEKKAQVSEFATLVIQRTITESLENVVLAKSSSQPKSTYEAAESVTEFELKKILLDKMHKTYSLKRDREDKDKDEDPPAGSDQGLKKRKTSKELNHQKASAQAKESVFETADTEMPQNQGGDLGNTDDQPNVEAASKSDWFKKLERPPTLDPDWNAKKYIDFRPPQTWISKIAKAKKSCLTFDELISNPIDFSAYVMNNLKIEILTQEHLVGPSFNLLKGTCRSRVELEYHFEEYRGRQVVPVNYFINNDLEYLKGGSSSRKYTTSTTKTKVVKSIKVRREDQKLYKFKEGDFPRLNLRDIEDMLLLLVQKKIANLEKDVIFHLNVALRMFTRRVVILKRVKDLQLGVKSYQKNSISLCQRHLDPTSLKELHTLHTSILKELSI
ncbi:hypothetical protein Tco_0255881 [Tanacetum coccineum]